MASLAEKERQVVFWRLLGATFGHAEQLPGFEAMARELAEREALPDLLLDPFVAVDTVVQRFPELQGAFDFADTAGEAPAATGGAGEPVEAGEPVDAGVSPASPRTPIDVREALLYSKLLLNAFGPNTRTPVVSAAQFQQWTHDVARFEQAFGYAPGGLRGGRGQGGVLVGEPELERALKMLEADLVQRMALREVLADDELASTLVPSMALVEQLLRDKSNLSGVALRNAKDLIRRTIDELAEVLKVQVEQAPSGKIDRSVPPKRVFRNLDLKRTLWRNLPNYNPKDGRIYVDRLYFRHTAKKVLPTRLIVVVDQSGSMVDSMVQCTILASIFAQLPHVDPHLIAFDTRVLDLTPWVRDPFEVLLRTQLGGGTYIRLALLDAMTRIEEPKNTVLVLISDFYEGGSDQELLDTIRVVKEMGVHLVPVGALTSSGEASVHGWFRTKLKELGTPILSGSVKKLVAELKARL